VLNRFCIKLFKTDDLDIIAACQEQSGLRLPIDLIASRNKKLEFITLAFGERTVNSTLI